MSALDQRVLDPRAATRGPGVLVQAWRLRAYWSQVLALTWRAGVVAAVVVPLLYLVAMGVFLGGFVSAGAGRLDGAPDYLTFVAPGLLASYSMQMSIGQATFPVTAGLKWNKTYFAMHAAPISPAAITIAHLSYVTVRTMLAATAFVLVLLPFGVLADPLAVPVLVLVQGLVAIAFAGPVFAYAVAVNNEWSFNLLFRLVMIPLFLFSGAFFPVGDLPGPLAGLARAMPLWHGVELSRALALGEVDLAAAVGHVAYLLILAVLGLAAATLFLRRRLVQ